MAQEPAETEMFEVPNVLRHRHPTFRTPLGSVAEMRELERSLEQFVQRYDVECAGGPAAECVILGNQADAGVDVDP
ncbi:MAG: hypothetical protein B7Z15_01930 [Rhizobiales bacterium 32-66-8]|nr:MAG: hypothetical protein B7Z15_01930 [Rhizobiales bacterium 32-66-8]